jgi:hypothetical protein
MSPHHDQHRDDQRSVPDHRATQRPQHSVPTARRSHPGGGHPQRAWGCPMAARTAPAVRASAKKSEGSRSTMANTSPKALTRRRRSRRFCADLLRPRPLTDCGARIAPGHRRKRLPRQEDARARGCASRKNVARCHAACACSCPRPTPSATTRASTSSSCCKDGVRRAYSMANAPHTQAEAARGVELHIRHMPGGKIHRPCVRRPEGERKSCASRARLAAFSCARIRPSPSCMLASGTGFAPVKALVEHMQFTWGISAPHHALLGRPSAGRPVSCTTGCWRAPRKCPTSPMCPWCPMPCPKTAWTRPHRLCAPGRAAGFCRPVGPPGVCLWRPHRGRFGTRRLQRRARPAARRVFCRLPSPPRPTSIRGDFLRQIDL